MLHPHLTCLHEFIATPLSPSNAMLLLLLAWVFGCRHLLTSSCSMFARLVAYVLLLLLLLLPPPFCARRLSTSLA
jgi:hypothetical protein